MLAPRSSHANRRAAAMVRMFWGMALVVAAALIAFQVFMLADAATDESGRQPWTARFDFFTLVRWAALIGVITAVAAGIGAVGIRRTQRRPLLRLMAAARQGVDSTIRVTMPAGAPEELAALARVLNDLRQRLRDRECTLEQQRETQESLLAQLAEGVVVARPDDRVALINPAAVRMLGISAYGDAAPAAFVGRMIEQCVPHHDLQELLRAATPREPDGPRPSAENRAVHVETAGGMFDLLARVVPITLPSGRELRGEKPTGAGNPESSTGRLLILTDITDMMRAMTIRTEFVSNASHELRTPISTIRAAVEGLLTLGPATSIETGRTFVEVIERQSLRLSELVSDLLDLARLESPTLRTEPESLNVVGELDELRARFAPAVAAKGLHWESANHDPTHRPIWLNRALLRMVLDNLVDNAAKFTDAGGRVRVEYRREPDRAVFSVSDTGCGIPPADQQRVFERFYQVERARSGLKRGTGLGLSIVRHAATALAGTVSLESEIGKGTTVTVSFPQAE